MKLTTYFLLFSILFIFSSCRKKDQPEMTTVTGKVLTYGTDDPIRHPPVKVQIVERIPVSTWGSGPTYEPLTETMSGKNHSFSLSHSLDPEKDYYLAVEGNTVKYKAYYAPTHSSKDRESRKITSVGGTINLNYYISARTWVKFHFVSENYQPGDTYSYNVGGGGFERFYGPVDTYRLWDFAGNWEHDIVYTLVRNGEYFPTREYFTPSPFDTIPYEVKF